MIIGKKVILPDKKIFIRYRKSFTKKECPTQVQYYNNAIFNVVCHKTKTMEIDKPSSYFGFPKWNKSNAICMNFATPEIKKPILLFTYGITRLSFSG